MTRRRALLALLLALLALANIAAAGPETDAPPRYVFLFIGDGMGMSHVAAAGYARGALQGVNSYQGRSFLRFEHIGLMTTHSATGAVTDSAAAATAMMTGRKTENGALNHDPDSGEYWTPITAAMKAAGYRVGVITTMSADHATPAALFASTPSRDNYTAIARQGLSGEIVDFWGAGGFSLSHQQNGGSTLERLLERSPYTVADTPEAIRALTSEDLPILALARNNVANPYMACEIDRLQAVAQGEDTMPLSALLDTAIQTLEDGPFFIMCEAGKIDSLSTEQDMVGMLYEVYALEAAVERAMAFARAHKEETLIIVLSDHETGGLRIRHDADWSAAALQKASYTRYSRILSDLYEEEAEEDALWDSVAEHFSLQKSDLSSDERDALLRAFADGADTSAFTDAEWAVYEWLRPAPYTLCRMVQGRMGVTFETSGHTGQPVPVYARGRYAERFAGVYDNTDVYHKLWEIMALGGER